MSCGASCGSFQCTSCTATEEHLQIESLLDKIILQELNYDDEAIGLLCQYITQGNYSGLCKLNNLFKKLDLTLRIEDFFLILKLFLRWRGGV